MFQEVMIRAVLDAVGITGLNNIERHDAAVREARVWFRFGENLDEYCGLVNLDTTRIRALVLAVPGAYRDALVS